MRTEKARILTLDGVDIRVRSVGVGEPVLCLHASGHDSHDFDALAARLAGRYTFIMVDWPGQGGSATDPQPASAERYGDLALALIDELRLPAPVIIGNSIGGAAAIRVAARRPVRALVLCDSGGLVEVTPIVALMCRAFERFHAAGARGAIWYPWVFALHYAFILPASAARAQRKRIVSAARRNAAVLRQAWASFGRKDADIRHLAAELAPPVWVAWAKRDFIIPLKVCLPAIQRIPQHSLTVFEGGHTPFLERTDEFAEGFEAFISSLRLQDAG